VHVQVIGALRKEHHAPISYIALDWHEMDKQLGHEGIVEAFWQTVGEGAYHRIRLNRLGVIEGDRHANNVYMM